MYENQAIILSSQFYIGMYGNIFSKSSESGTICFRPRESLAMGIV